MIIALLTFLQKKLVSPDARKFFKKIGLYVYIKNIYRTFIFLIGKNGLKLKIKDVSVKIFVSHPHELNYYYSLSGEREFLQKFLNKINSQTVFYDIGAYIGLYSLCAARYKIIPKSIYCWEPDPFNFKRIQENINLNNADVIAFPVALGEKDAVMEMSTGAEGLGSSQSSLVRKGHKSVSVKVVNGDAWIFRQKINLPTIIKIDVEGYEFNVLNGLKETIKKSHSDIFLEIHPIYLKRVGLNEECILNFLKNLNYKITPFPLLQRQEKHYICEFSDI